MTAPFSLLVHQYFQIMSYLLNNDDMITPVVRLMVELSKDVAQLDPRCDSTIISPIRIMIHSDNNTL